MSVEHALLDRLEKRSLQIAQMKREIHGLQQLRDEKMAINEQLAEQITTARLEREQMQHQITELRTERDRIREISKSLVPKSALEQAVQEAAELSAEVSKLRAEVPLESTREALKNAVAKLQEVTTDRDRLLNELAAILAEANKSGRCNGDPVALIKQGQNDLDALRSLEREYAESDKLIDRRQQESSAAQEDRNQAEADAKTAQADAQRLGDECERLAGKVAELEAQKSESQLLSRYESLLTKITDLGSYAMTIGRKEGEPLAMFMERQAVRLAALESQGEYSTKVSSQLGERIAHAQKRAMAYETAFMRIKSYRNTDAEQQCSLIHQIIDATEEELGIRLTA